MQEVAAHNSLQGQRPPIVKNRMNGRGRVPRPRPLGLFLFPLLVLPLLLPQPFRLALFKPFKAFEDTPFRIEVNKVELQCAAPFVSVTQRYDKVGYVSRNRRGLCREQGGNVCDQLRLVFTGERVAVERVTNLVEVMNLTTSL